MKKVYACSGSCGGVSPVSKNCGAKNCEMYDEPLEEKEMCESCGAIVEVGEEHSC